MNLDAWLRVALIDAVAVGLPELPSLVESLGASTRALRAADWNLRADAPLPGEPVRREGRADEDLPVHATAGGPGAEVVEEPGFVGRTDVKPVRPAVTEQPAEPVGPRPVLVSAPGATAEEPGFVGRTEAPSLARAGARHVTRHPGREDVPLNLQPLDVLARRLRAREMGSRELTEACLATIEARNPEINAFITVTGDAARKQAARADEEISAGRWRGPLHGIPVSVKDMIDLEGLATTAGSRLRAATIATRDATAVARLREAGAVFVGKCNLHEFALGTTSEDSAWGPVRHPRFTDRSPGGSSGGSAAAIASGMCIASVGTDTGGSIRIPAAACGLVGFKPPFGAVPADGVVPLARTLDHVGPLARRVRDAWWMWLALTGALTDDSIPPARALLGSRVLGLLRPYFTERLDAEVRGAFEHAVTTLRAAGAVLRDVAIPHAPLTAPVYLHLALAEAAAYHAPTLESRAAEYTPPVRLRLELGRYILGEDTARAITGRDALRAEVDAALEECDALILPTLPIPAPVLGASSVDLGGTRDSVRNATLRLTQIFNLTGHPALTLPCGTTAGGLPVGLQLVGRGDDVASLVSLAEACEEELSR